MSGLMEGSIQLHKGTLGRCVVGTFFPGLAYQYQLISNLQGVQKDTD